MKFMLGSAMGFALGAGLMMAPGAGKMRRDMRRKVQQVKKQLRQM